MKVVHSVNLLSVADANVCFTVIDVGAYGRENDSRVGSTAELWDHDADTQHVWRYSRSMQFRVPFLYPQCNTHSTHTALPV